MSNINLDAIWENMTPIVRLVIHICENTNSTVILTTAALNTLQQNPKIGNRLMRKCKLERTTLKKQKKEIATGREKRISMNIYYILLPDYLCVLALYSKVQWSLQIYVLYIYIRTPDLNQ